MTSPRRFLLAMPRSAQTLLPWALNSFLPQLTHTMNIPTVVIDATGRPDPAFNYGSLRMMLPEGTCISDKGETHYLHLSYIMTGENTAYLAVYYDTLAMIANLHQWAWFPVKMKDPKQGMGWPNLVALSQDDVEINYDPQEFVTKMSLVHFLPVEPALRDFPQAPRNAFTVKNGATLGEDCNHL